MRTIRCNRPAGRGAISAPTIMALLAMTAAASVWSGPASIEARAPLADAAKVRAVAAVVKAVARDLFRADQTVTAIALALPEASILCSDAEVAIVPIASDLPAGRILSERLLDLPPPMC